MSFCVASEGSAEVWRRLSTMDAGCFWTTSREVRGSPATIEYYGRRLLLRGCSIWSASVSFCVAGAALSVILRGRCSTRSISVSFCVAGASVGAPPDRSAQWTPAAFAWQVQHLEHLSLILRGRCSIRSTLERSAEVRRRLNTMVAGCVSVAGAALGAPQSHFAWLVCHFAWQVHQFEAP